MSFFNLQDLYVQPRLRDQLLPRFSEPLEKIRKRVKEGPPDRHLFDGLHCFLFGRLYRHPIPMPRVTNPAS